MKKTVVLLLLGLIILTNSRSFGQYGVSTGGDEDGFTNHISLPGVPGPTAAALGSYANYGVSQFTGVPDISVPLYEVSEDGFKLPISLSYNASGVKVNDIASWVGMNWSLNAGGVITRNINDVPDDLDLAPFKGWLYEGNFNVSVSDCNANNGCLNPFYNVDAGVVNECGMHGIRFSHYDTEPDIFFFNFAGHTGKFVFSKGDPITNLGTDLPAQSHKICLIPYQDLKFSYTLDQANYLFISSFIVSDEDGNMYTFANPELDQTYFIGNSFTSPCHPVEGLGGYNGSPFHYTSWYLSKITTNKGKVINFTYSSEYYMNELPPSYSVRNFLNGGNGCSAQMYSSGFTSDIQYETRTSNPTTPILSSIEGDDFKIAFTTIARADVSGMNKLSAIQIYSKSQPNVGSGIVYNLIKQFDFDYATTEATIDPSSYSSPSIGDANQRFFLSTVKERGSAGDLKPPYTFQYDNTYPLPGRYSYSQDFWGYYNNSGCQNPIPTMYVYPNLVGNDRFHIYPISGYTGTSFTFNGSNRFPNADAMKSGTLTQITYPTGGYQQFQYEPNTYYYENENFTGGGLRLLQSTLYDGISHNNDIIKQYTYTQSADNTKSSGVLLNLPFFAYTENFANYWNCSEQGLYGEGGEHPTTSDYFAKNMVISSMPNFTLGGYDGVNVGYSEIKEHTIGKGSILSKYGTPARYGDPNDGAGGPCSASTNGYCDGYYQETVPVTWAGRYCLTPNEWDPEAIEDPAGLSTGPGTYPFAPNTNYDWDRGLLYDQQYFSETNALIKEIQNTYSIYTPNNAGPTYVYGLRKALVQNWLFQYATGCGEGGPPFYSLSMGARYPVITQIAKVLSQRITKTYSSDYTGNYIQSTENYTYSPNEKMPDLIQTNASDGDQISTYITHPFDYTVTGTSTNADYLGLQALQTGHAVAPVIETYTQLKTPSQSTLRTIDAKLTTYNVATPGALVTAYPHTLYQMETNQSVTNFTPTTVGTGGLGLYSLYKSQGTYDLYDANSNPKQITDRAGVSSVALWGYDESIPVAEVENATVDQVAYTSFEEDDQLAYNWEIDGGYSSLGIKNKTGDYSYDLRSGDIKTNTYIPAATYVVSLWSDYSGMSVFARSSGGSVVNATFVKASSPDANGMAYYEYNVTIPTGSNYSVYIEDDGTGLPAHNYIDEVRLYPINAQMKTYTYNELVGVTSTCDENNLITTYEYDEFNRLIIVRDKDGNITKKYEYGIQASE